MSPQLSGPTDPIADAAWPDPPPRKGFFTDTSICIGCKACEVACKEWNMLQPDGSLDLLGSSYDNTGALGADTWRHVAFVEQDRAQIEQARATAQVDLGMPAMGPPGSPTGVSMHEATEQAVTAAAGGTLPDFRWLMSSDVCKHCTHAGCLDVCPTGSLFRTEFGTVVVQEDICNGCGYCVAGCPFGVIERRAESKTVKTAGVAQKCTLCYDRLGHDQTPACAQTCPTTSIKFGDLTQLRAAAQERVQALHQNGFPEARLYGADEQDGVGGTGSVFLLLAEPEVYGLPPDPVVPTAHLREMFDAASLAAAGLLLGAVISFAGWRR